MKQLFFLFSVLFIISCNTSTTNEMQGNQSVTLQTNDALSARADMPKETIENWVKDVTDSSSKDFIPIKDRIAVFDNDGTLWHIFQSV